MNFEVMRLLKPSFYPTLPVFTEGEHNSESFSKLLLDQTFDPSGHNALSGPNSALTDFLVIPQIFGYFSLLSLINPIHFKFLMLFD